MKKHNLGFTLIELLVVIAIIGMLSSVVLASLNSARAKARDARRLADMKQIITALELYYDDHDRYPQENSAGGSWEHSFEDNGDFIDELLDKGYMPSVPVDPINTSSGGFYYSYYNYGGDSGCTGNFYVLGVRNMETSGRPHPHSPGFACPTRDWETEFDWVIGAFE